MNRIKKSLITVSALLALGLVVSGCGKKSSDSVSEAVIIDTTKTEGPPTPNHKVLPLDLGIAESFAIMAYSAITSSPTSNISGKVGLKPGTRTLLALDAATEVDGGSINIYSGDDTGDKAIYLTLAREDLISAYKEAAARPADKDKVEAYAGKLGGKILPPGIYQWSSGVSVDTDFILEGTSKDVWIFQITGDVFVASGAHMKLMGGAKARNVYWQVSGKVNLEARSVVAGTIMSQLTFEMKSSAKINGRALVKNGKLLLHQNVIALP